MKIEKEKETRDRAPLAKARRGRLRSGVARPGISDSVRNQPPAARTAPAVRARGGAFAQEKGCHSTYGSSRRRGGRGQTFCSTCSQKVWPPLSQKSCGPPWRQLCFQLGVRRRALLFQ